MAQLVERLLCKQDVAGSNPATSTKGVDAPSAEGASVRSGAPRSFLGGPPHLAAPRLPQQTNSFQRRSPPPTHTLSLFLPLFRGIAVRTKSQCGGRGTSAVPVCFLFATGLSFYLTQRTQRWTQRAQRMVWDLWERGFRMIRDSLERGVGVSCRREVLTQRAQRRTQRAQRVACGLWERGDLRFAGEWCWDVL